jgi:hypothetical protein
MQAYRCGLLIAARNRLRQRTMSKVHVVQAKSISHQVFQDNLKYQSFIQVECNKPLCRSRPDSENQPLQESPQTTLMAQNQTNGGYSE